MSEEKSPLGQVVKQSSGVLEKAYDDLAHPSAKSIGNTLSLLPRTVGVWLGKWEKWVVNGEESIRLTGQAVQEKAAKIPEEKLTEPEPYVAIPAIQQLSYCYNSKELREMYANLLISSMNIDTKWQVHPSFVDIIKQLSPMDAKGIERIKNIGNTMPIITIILKFDESGFIKLVQTYSIDLFSVYGDVEIQGASLQNLARLGLISIRYDQIVKPVEAYEKFKTDEVFKSIEFTYEEASGMQVDFSKGLLELTDFGKLFCKVCCE